MTSTIPTTSGIYRIVCMTTGNIYVGSTKNLFRRRNDHFDALRKKTHNNPYLQNAWNKYTEAAFFFEVIELVLPAFLLEREQYWLDRLLPFPPHGYNIARFAHAVRLGAEVSNETREKLRLAQLGKKQSEVTKQKKSEAGKNRSHTLETRAKMCIAQRNRPPTKPESIEKIRAARLGKRATTETRQKMSRARAGRVYNTRRKTLIITDPNGTEYTVTGIQSFCKEHHLHQSAITYVAQGKANHHKGWKARFPD